MNRIIWSFVVLLRCFYNRMKFKKASAPKSERNVQEFFSLIFSLRIPRSLPLLSEGIIGFSRKLNFTISAYCWLTASRNNRISSVMSCNTFDISVTCSFIGVKVQRKSEIRKKNKHFYRSLHEDFRGKNTDWSIPLNSYLLVLDISWCCILYL